jgi:ubiquinone/menaquinone biosynthesis C-methylase UbiE
MFHQNLGPIVQRAMLELNNFKPSILEKYDREVLIRLYWQYHPRFKSFKILSTKNANMLDIGSGNGGLFYWKEYLLPARADMKMTALDLQKGEHFGKYERYLVFNLDSGDIPLPDNSFDFIFLSHLIEHVSNWKSLVENCARLLKSNGTIYIETPSKHTIDLPSKEFYIQKGYLCTTINFKDDFTHVETVDLDEVGDFSSEFNLITLEKGICKIPFLENTLLSAGLQQRDAELCQYGLWSKLLFSSYLMLCKQ